MTQQYERPVISTLYNILFNKMLSADKQQRARSRFNTTCSSQIVSNLHSYTRIRIETHIHNNMASLAAYLIITIRDYDFYCGELLTAQCLAQSFSMIIIQ